MNGLGAPLVNGAPRQKESDRGDLSQPVSCSPHVSFESESLPQVSPTLGPPERPLSV